MKTEIYKWVETCSVHFWRFNIHLLLSTIFGKACLLCMGTKNVTMHDLIGLFVLIHIPNFGPIKLNVCTLSAKEIYGSYIFQLTHEFLIRRLVDDLAVFFPFAFHSATVTALRQRNRFQLHWRTCVAGDSTGDGWKPGNHSFLSALWKPLSALWKPLRADRLYNFTELKFRRLRAVVSTLTSFAVSTKYWSHASRPFAFSSRFSSSLMPHATGSRRAYDIR